MDVAIEVMSATLDELKASTVDVDVPSSVVVPVGITFADVVLPGDMVSMIVGVDVLDWPVIILDLLLIAEGVVSEMTEDCITSDVILGSNVVDIVVDGSPVKLVDASMAIDSVLIVHVSCTANTFPTG